MTIVEDTRQKQAQHGNKHQYFTSEGIRLIRCKLPFGDYALPPRVVVDTKQGLEEIASNIGSDHVRFKNECIAARDAGCQLYILVENEIGIASIDDVHTWVNPRSVYSPGCIQGGRLEKAMRTMTERYGVRFLFCHPDDAGGIIEQLLRE